LLNDYRALVRDVLARLGGAEIRTFQIEDIRG
jgi:hypothetical protein